MMYRWCLHHHRQTPCRTPGRSSTARSSSSPVSDGCCSTVTGIPESRTSGVCLYGLVRLPYRTEGRRKKPCPWSSQPCNLPSTLTSLSFFAVSSAVSQKNLIIHAKSGEVEIGTAPPGWIVVAAADSRSPLLLPEQAKMCESSLFTRSFTHFGSFRGKRMAPEPKLRCLYIFLFHFSPLILWPPAYQFCGFSQKRAHRSPCDFTVEKWPRPPAGMKKAPIRLLWQMLLSITYYLFHSAVLLNVLLVEPFLAVFWPFQIHFLIILFDELLNFSDFSIIQNSSVL